jgi:hypothetical protein
MNKRHIVTTLFCLLTFLAPAALADSDSDGLTDAEEAVLGTDPYDPDTDNDGRIDGDEVANATNPLASYTPLDGWIWSPDVTVNSGSGVFDDEEVVEEDSILPLAPVDIGTIPPEADLVAFHRDNEGRRFFALDITALLSNGLIATPRMVIRAERPTGSWDYTVHFNGDAEGLFQAPAIDAVTLTDDGVVLLSFEESIELGPGMFADDEDVIAWDVNSGFALYLDGSAAGIPEHLDIDALHLLDNDRLLMSFDTAGALGIVLFQDEDLLEYDPESGVWEKNRDMADIDTYWERADLDALTARAYHEDECLDGLDNDLDGATDCDDDDCQGPDAPDADLDGVKVCDDCNDYVTEIWLTPGEVRDLRIGKLTLPTTRLDWQPPAEPGALFPVYDTLRSDVPHDFAAAHCLVEDDEFTWSLDYDLPDPEALFFYLIRAENDCPDGMGTLGFGGFGERTGRACP